MSIHLGGLTREMFCLDRRAFAIHPQRNDPFRVKEPDASLDGVPPTSLRVIPGVQLASRLKIGFRHQPASAGLVSKTCPRIGLELLDRWPTESDRKWRWLAQEVVTVS